MMNWDVIRVVPVNDARLHVTFQDGLRGEVEFEPSFFTGVFAHLSDPTAFRQVRIEHGAVSWPGDLDLASDAMHRSLADAGDSRLITVS